MSFRFRKIGLYAACLPACLSPGAGAARLRALVNLGKRQLFSEEQQQFYFFPE